MDKYKIVTDETFYDKFGWLSNRVKSLGGFFQNDGLVAEQDEIEEWDKNYEAVIIRLIELKAEGLARLEKVKEGE